MSATDDRRKPRLTPSQAHADHLQAHEDHAAWMKDLERWRGDLEQALTAFASRMLPELELDRFLDAIERHEAAIVTHEELVDQHERRLRRQRAGREPASEEADSLHEVMHDRHELSRAEHAELAERIRAILEALRG